MNVNYIKWLGLIGALFAGASQIASGDVVNGAGVIAASFASAGVFKKTQ